MKKEVEDREMGNEVSYGRVFVLFETVVGGGGGGVDWKRKR